MSSFWADSWVLLINFVANVIKFMESKTKNNDYLKYWRVVRYFVRVKYGLSTSDIDVLLFLYSEKYFAKSSFDEFNRLISWDKDRFKTLLRDGWIEVFRKRRGKYATLYQLSFKAQRVVDSIYKKLNGEEIPVNRSANPLFLKNVSYTDKAYRDMIIQMNEFIQQQRHRAPEE